MAWTQVVALAANLLACFRHLALPDEELCAAAPKLLRYRLLHLPARLTRGQRRRWMHLRGDWPWATDGVNAWREVTALTAPTTTEGPPPRSVEPRVPTRSSDLDP